MSLALPRVSGVGGGEVGQGVLLQLLQGPDGRPLAPLSIQVLDLQEAVLVVEVLEDDVVLDQLAVLLEAVPGLPGCLGEQAAGPRQHVVDTDIEVLVKGGLAVSLHPRPQTLFQDFPV